MREEAKGFIRKAAFVAAFALLAACGSKVTAENFLKVKNGMGEDEVRALLGKPAKVENSTILSLEATTYRYEKGKNVVEVNFINGKVMSKNGSLDK